MRFGSVAFLRISIVGVLGQEVLGIGTRISRGLGSGRLSIHTCRGNGQTNELLQY